jgi:hypothetical protein
MTTATEPQAWQPIRSAGSWGVATTNDPADVTAALALPGSWRIGRRKALIRRDQWANLGPGSGPPTLTIVTPAFGPEDGGTACVVNGHNLAAPVLAVMFGSNQATGVQLLDSTRIACISPAGSGLVNVQAVAPTGTNAVQFEYRASNGED